MRQVDQAVTYFKQLGEVDPYRLDNLDTYSNLLYVKEQRVELAHLAHRTNMIDKYRTETCCVIGMAGFSVFRKHSNNNIWQEITTVCDPSMRRQLYISREL